MTKEGRRGKGKINEDKRVRDKGMDKKSKSESEIERKKGRETKTYSVKER